MTNPDELERLARACNEGDPWYTSVDLITQPYGSLLPQDRAFIAAANPATILDLLAANRKMREALENFVSGIERAPISWETGVCCCGNSVDGHGFGDGHSPVDEGVHFVTSLITEARSALSTKETT
jgi:hypothetical protein